MWVFDQNARAGLIQLARTDHSGDPLECKNGILKYAFDMVCITRPVESQIKSKRFEKYPVIDWFWVFLGLGGHFSPSPRHKVHPNDHTCVDLWNQECQWYLAQFKRTHNQTCMFNLNQIGAFKVTFWGEMAVFFPFWERLRLVFGPFWA